MLVCVLLAATANAQVNLDLTLSWKDNHLQIDSDGFAGGRIDVLYLEAFCRSGAHDRRWEETTIPHTSRLVGVVESRKEVRVRTVIQPKLEIEHRITAGPDSVDFEVTFKNKGPEAVDVQWAQPCIDVRIFTGADQRAYTSRCFLFTEDGPRYLDTLPQASGALYEGGQVYAVGNIPHTELNPRPISSVTPTLPLIGCVSAEGHLILATAWSDTQELFQGVRNCIHSDFHIGGLAPGETKKLHGKIYIMENDARALVQRYFQDFGGTPPASLEKWSMPALASGQAERDLPFGGLAAIPNEGEDAQAAAAVDLQALREAMVDAEPAEMAVPLLRAHAHNDYRHARPLLDALDAGFCSIEADIHLVDGQLLVAHDSNETDPERTLEKLYLAPLRERVEQNGGRVYPGGPPVTLLIDIKSEGEAVYPVLRQVLEQYAAMLTHFTDETTEESAVTVIISGDVPRTSILADSPRLMAIDGRLADIGGPLNANQAPLISASWRDAFTWLGQGPIPPEQHAKMRELVEQTHAKGQRLRFWALPLRPAVWPVLHETGVDLINADNLQALRDFLIEQRVQE